MDHMIWSCNENYTVILRFISKVYIEAVQKIKYSGEKMEASRANRRIDFYADSWYGKKAMEWSMYPVGR